MKFLQIVQYACTALAIFIVFYFSYVITIGLGVVILPLLFVMIFTGVLYATLTKDDQE